MAERKGAHPDDIEVTTQRWDPNRCIHQALRTIELGEKAENAIGEKVSPLLAEYFIAVGTNFLRFALVTPAQLEVDPELRVQAQNRIDQYAERTNAFYAANRSRAPFYTPIPITPKP